MSDLAEIRAARDLSQGRLAREADVSLATIANIERGRVKAPQKNSAERIARVLIEFGPLSQDEIVGLATDLSLQPLRIQRLQAEAAKAPARGGPPDAARENTHREIDRMIDEYGIDDVRAVVLSMGVALERIRKERERTPVSDAASSVRFLSVSPPVQRPGYVEQTETETETEYETRPAPPASSSRGEQAGRAAGRRKRRG